ncbi:DUF4360 domain-containing protein [Actinomadura litoris]|uniref:DUF4360 domain-containing protein n=1 Tax=Actinomadura litoris TaxID=2678616 RepID=UPI001FA7A992|nr:DUF4360 domain-containing protein [Actinomadura litoris]
MKKTRKAALAAIGATALPALTALPASADPAPPATIQVVSSPTSCPVGTMVVSSSPREGRISLHPSNFKASVGKDVPAEEARKSCELSLRLIMPVSSTWALESIDSRGTANLDPEVVGEVSQSYHLQGSTRHHKIVHTLKAPNDTLRFEDETPLEFAPCGQQRDLDLETRLRVKSPDEAGAGSVAMEFPGGGTTYNFVYKTCEPPE